MRRRSWRTPSFRWPLLLLYRARGGAGRYGLGAMRWIIGDVHGMLRPLKGLVAEVRRHDPESRLIFAGDYVNRGPEARGVIDFLLALENATFIRGNHDDIFDLVINGQCYAENAARDDRVAAFLWFMKYGLDATLMSYDCDYAFLDSLTEKCTVGLLDTAAARGEDGRLTAYWPENRTFIQADHFGELVAAE